MLPIPCLPQGKNKASIDTGFLSPDPADWEAGFYWAIQEDFWIPIFFMKKEIRGIKEEKAFSLFLCKFLHGSKK